MAAVLLATASLFGCASTARQKAVPSDLETRATVSGFEGAIRYFPRDAGQLSWFKEDFIQSWNREKAALRAEGHDGPLPPADYLAISGGGDNGAFGAGLLNGWTSAGTRPKFKLVTGISTGALIAPLAFLGPSWDGRLKSFYTGVAFKDIASMRSVFSALFGDALADTTPLWKMLQKLVTPEMLEAIAAEHEKGRILLIGTTNLDARRPVIWNVTKIAASRRPEALDLIRKILLASAAIPGTFPPVMIDVEAGTQKFAEMHVDGGTAAQVFVYPAGIRLSDFAQSADAARRRTLYIIRNARLDPDWAQVERRTLPIAMRAITCLIQYQGLGDLYRIYSVTQRDGVDFNLAYIPPTFRTPHTADFDPSYMKSLFQVGYDLAKAGYEWVKQPPALATIGADDVAAPVP